MNSEELKLTGRRAGRSSKEIKDLLQKFERSGDDIKSFCQAHNIGVSTLQKWKSRYGKKEGTPVMEEGFISLQVSPVAAAGNMEGLFAEVKGIKLYQPVAASYLKELLQ
jgi:hypothetical protein